MGSPNNANLLDELQDMSGKLVREKKRLRSCLDQQYYRALAMAKMPCAVPTPERAAPSMKPCHS